MKVLVTGGAGFIGSHLAEALCRRGAEVVVVDNLSLGAAENLAWKRAGDRLDFVQGDAGDELLMRRVMAGCEWVFHEAALPSVPMSVNEPVATHRDNLTMALQLLVLARDLGVKRFMFASSSAIYGESEVVPKVESHAPAPMSPYALQKYGAERYGQMFFQYHGLETVALRYFNVFGPRQSFNSPYSGVIARFCTAMLKGERPIIFGDGRQSRDFVAVSNVVQANLLAAEAPRARAAGQVFNVGCGASINLLQLVEELNRLTGQSLQPRFEPARAGDVRVSEADIGAARQALGYEPRVTWQTGLADTLQFYRDNQPR